MVAAFFCPSHDIDGNFVASYGLTAQLYVNKSEACDSE